MSETIEIIAENAQGFEGSPALAMQLLRACAAAGATAAKYQLIYADELATPDYEYYEQNKELEMPDDVWLEVVEYSKKLGIEVIFDIFGSTSLKLAENLGTQTVMLHATDITNFSLIELVAAGPIDRVILGAGGAFLPEIERAIEMLDPKRVCVMLGYQGFPTPTEDNQIARVRYLSSRLGEKFENVSVGFSDHSLPDSNLLNSLSAMALGAGATSFEKHLTISQVMKYEDYESAINPDKFYQYTKELLACAEAFGQVSIEADFGMKQSEMGYRQFVRRNVITARDIPSGTVVSGGDFMFKRSSLENVITSTEEILGKRAVRDLACNTPVLLSDFH